MGIDGYTDGLSVLKDPHVVVTSHQAAEVANVVNEAEYWSFDVEATSLYFHEAKHHGVAVATPDHEFYITYGSHPSFYQQASKLKIFQRKWVFMHNAAYDVPFVHRYIPNIPIRVFDTLLAQHTIDENQRLGLKPLAQHKLNAPLDLADYAELQKEAARIADVRGFKQMTVLDMPFDKLCQYAMRDVRYTLDLGLVSANELRSLDLWDVFMQTVLPFFPVIVEMESAGVYIDQTKLAEIDNEYHTTLNEYQEKWDALTENTNPRSTPQMQELLYEKLELPVIAHTKTGNPSTSSKTISRLIGRQDITDPEHPLSIFVEMSKIQTLVNVIDGIKYSIEDDGRVYSKFNQAITRTGRLSSSGVKDSSGNQKGLNNQNIPSHSPEAKRVRETWAAAPGKVLGVWDYSQLELRIGAHYMSTYIAMLLSQGKTHYTQKRQRYNNTLEIPQTPQLMQAFLDGLDPHQLTADTNGIPRPNAKTVNFGTFYGMGADKFIIAIELATGHRITKKEAYKQLNGFALTYPEYPIWQDAVLVYVHSLGYVRTIAGRRRRLPDINSTDGWLRSRAERQAVNAIIQGSAADIMNKASVDILKYIRQVPHLMSGNSERMKIVGQIHDEIAIEGTREQVEFAEDTIKKLMKDAGEFYGLTTPLEVDGGIGSNWTEAK